MYCTYITIYSGNQLPPFYIGSSSIERIENGYRGSVSSKYFKQIWKDEIKNNPQMFKTKIISVHKKRTDAYQKEEKLQKQLNVVDNSLYINKNMWQGHLVSGSGELNNNYGNKWCDKRRQKMSKLKKEWSKNNINPMKGKKRPDLSKLNTSRAYPIIIFDSNWKYITTYDTTMQATNNLQISKNNINAIAAGWPNNHYKTSQGYKFVYKHLLDDKILSQLQKFGYCGRKPVKIVDEFENDIAYFSSATHASQTTSVKFDNINKCLLGMSNTAGGYIWRYFDPLNT